MNKISNKTGCAAIEGVGKALRAFLIRRVEMQADQIPYVFKNQSYRKITNWALAEASARLHPLKSWGMPTHLQLEPAGVCNLQCALCPVTEGMNRSGGLMSLDLFKALIDEIGEWLFMIFLWDWGEPFMNPNLCAMIEYAQARSIRTIVSTNGHLLTDPELAERVVQSGLDTLIFAIDGISQDTYERYRGRGRLADALAGLKAVVVAREKMDRKHPLINFRFIAMSHNEHEIPLLENFVRATGADVLTIKTLNTCANDTYGEHADERAKREDMFLPKAQRYCRFAPGSESSSRVRRDFNACKNLWNSPTVHWDGTVSACTYDYDERFVLGKLKTQAFAEIWNGPAYREMRQHFIQQDIHFCRECSYAFVGGNCQDETVRNAQRLNSDAIPA